MIILPFLNAFRNTAFFEVEAKEALESVVGGLSSVWLEGDYDAYTMLTLTIEYVELYGITWGYQLLGVFLFWLPRSIWNAKPVGSGYHVASALSWRFRNVSCPLPGEGIINFGFVGMFFFAVIIGLIIAKIDRSYWRNLETTGKRVNRSSAIYVVCMAFFFFMCRGDLLSSFAYMIAYVAVWVCLVVLTRFSIKRGSLVR